MCTRAPAIEAMLWQNVNRRWKIWMREKENNTTIWSDFIHVLLVNLIHTFCATHSYRSYFVSHSLLVYFLLLKSARAKSRLFVCQFEQNFSNITPYFSHWHTHTAKLSIQSPLIQKAKASVSVVPFDFQFNTFSMAKISQLCYTSVDRSKTRKTTTKTNRKNWIAMTKITWHGCIA